jgi:DNA-binding response OmpR family regulator
MGTETVLLVEDDDLVRRFARDVLERNGYVVYEAASGPEAVNVARLNTAAIQLVVSDVVMPGMSGTVLRRRLDALGVKAPVLFMSGHPQDAAALGEVENRDAMLLQKPFAAGDLLFKVRRVLDAR